VKITATISLIFCASKLSVVLKELMGRGFEDLARVMEIYNLNAVQVTSGTKSNEATAPTTNLKNSPQNKR